MSPKLAPTTENVPAISDPVWRAAMGAPIDTTPDTEEELAAIDEVRRGGFCSTPGSVVSAEIARHTRAAS